MRWREGRQSDNVEDRRNVSSRGLAVGGGVGTLLLVIVAYFMGFDPQALLQMGDGGGAQQEAPAEGPPRDEMGQFVSAVLADTEDVWSQLLPQLGKRYEEPTLVLFRNQVRSACGLASAAVGPFYCPGDAKVYIDLSFYQELRSRLGAPGDFAQAYVIAHEIGHHVQNLLGVSDRVHDQRSRLSETDYNQLSVRLELQADFYAGVWAHHAQKARNVLEAGDLEEALGAASAIGDDRLQKQAQGHVVPDSFTHGTSAQRVRWFRRGFDTGDARQGDTFAARDL